MRLAVAAFLTVPDAGGSIRGRVPFRPAWCAAPRAVAGAPRSSMVRVLVRLLVTVSFLAALAPRPCPRASGPLTPAQAAARRIGFYFGLRLTSLEFPEPANDIAAVVDPPPFPGLPFDPNGVPTDVDFGDRLNLEFFV